MPNPHRSFLAEAQRRGYIHQCTDHEGLEARLSFGPASAYIGFDCTADSLHVGSLLQIMLLRLWQRTGNRPIVLLGGGTTKVGDPSGKDEARRLLSNDEIAANKRGIGRIFARFLSLGDGPEDGIILDNADWLDPLLLIDFLRDYGRHFSVNRMLSQDSIRLRLEREQPLSFLEFNYLVLQAYDFLELARRQGCVVQMGGSDQWGNIVAGIELGRRVEDHRLFGLTSPLITTASGAKMGKTAQGAVWLNAERLSPYDYWQFWRNTEDADVGRFLRLFTELPLEDIERLEANKGAGINEAKKILATEATALAHGRPAAEGAGAALPQIEVPRDVLERGVAAFELFVRAGLAASNGEARRLIKGGGARLNDAAVATELQPVTLADLNPDGAIKLSAGRKRHALIRPV